MRDPVIIGAGIQGASLALAATARGLRPILVERDAEPAGATINSYGIVHGGLRYLQSLDIARWSQSRRAQQWYIDRYPHHVRPLRCVMPLYRGAVRSPALFRAARAADRTLRTVLGRRVNLPADGACSREDILSAYGVDPAGLLGGAVWHDACLPGPAALLREMLTEVEDRGGTVLRSTEAVALATDGRILRGLHLRSRKDGREQRIAAEEIFDCTGGSAREWLCSAAPLGRPSAATLAFNLLLDIPAPPGSNAYALSPRAGKGRSYFFRAHDGGTLVGTFYRPAPGEGSIQPSEQDIAAALRQIGRCLPGQPVGREAVRSIHAGMLPDRDGTGSRLLPADRHIRLGPHGYHIVLGGKLTTAPLLSERVARAAWRTIPPARTAIFRNRHA